MQKEKNIRVRFAPSPTGYFHIGSARASFFNFLYAKRNNGTFVLRIEDTDKERSKKEYENDIMRSLKWLGINWDEGVVEEGEIKKEKGEYGPYRQSEREGSYEKYILQLIEEKKAYYCFCDKEILEKTKEKQRENKETLHYNGKCFSLSEEEVKKMLEEKKRFTIRLHLPENETIEFIDSIRGKVTFNSKDIGGDFVIAKDDFSPLYNFACVIDDYEMKITDVIRGEDHISNTPKQILIQRALGIPSPRYAHLPLILGTDKSKLSKRHGAVSLYEYKNEGYLPEALINFIAFLGWNPGDEKEIYSLNELVEKFSLERCQKSGAVFDIKKLDYLNGLYIRKMDINVLAKMCLPYLIDANLLSVDGEKTGDLSLKPIYKINGKEKELVTLEHLALVVSLYQERLKKLSEIIELVDYFFLENINYEKELLFWKDAKEKETEASLKKTIEVLSKIEKWEKGEIENALMELANKEENRGLVLWPVRVALSGKKASAGPFDIAWVLGLETTIKRLKMAKNKLKL